MAAAKSHVIELASPAFVRARYVRRIADDGGFTVTTDPARARTFRPADGAKALGTIQPAIEAGAWLPTLVPVAALRGVE